MTASAPRQPRLGLPHLGDGVGLRDPHCAHLMATPPEQWGVDWFEVISENYIGHHGWAAHVLERVAAHRPVVMHGVSLSIGSAEPLDLSYLDQLAALAERVKPAWISDHLCWTGIAGFNTHDLLPMPLSETSLAHVVGRIGEVQDRLGRLIVLENPSSYLQFRADQMPEWEYIARMAEESGCGLLLDVNNVWVSSVNHGFDPVAYIEAIPADHVVQIHVAGPTDCLTHFMDTHDSPVRDEVWALYRLAQERTGGVSTLLEWDSNIPAWPDLLGELGKAKAVREGWLPAAEAA
ncbi:MAG: DUF692 domain-containing protein [Alphaproteobacteria bacterium]|nr:MAG: DUF692 domain-containing protein [Alphaproteobacteria bacterium]